MKSYKILVVDNDSGALHIINQILLKSNKKFEVLNAHSGKIALDIIKYETPDLIITDWDMPEMTGIELIEILKKDTSTSLIRLPT